MEFKNVVQVQIKIQIGCLYRHKHPVNKQVQDENDPEKDI